MPQVKILAFAGSLRKDSHNKKLVKVAAKGAEAAGAQVTYLDLRDLNLPVYDGDLEAEITLPEGARRLKQLMDSHDGFLIASPEYNGSITGALKNAIDWVSRQQPDEKPYQQFVDKIAVLMSASEGYFGGVRSVMALRQSLNHIQMLVLPQQVNIPFADKAFNEDGTLKDAKRQYQTEKLGRELVEFIAKLKRE
jgi:chromate reductase, NAD(P)H dehydrogenase (quinone)